jgi:hypothetical protein
MPYSRILCCTLSASRTAPQRRGALSLQARTGASQRCPFHSGRWWRGQVRDLDGLAEGAFPIIAPFAVPPSTTIAPPLHTEFSPVRVLAESRMCWGSSLVGVEVAKISGRTTSVGLGRSQRDSPAALRRLFPGDQLRCSLPGVNPYDSWPSVECAIAEQPDFRQSPLQ